MSEGIVREQDAEIRVLRHSFTGVFVLMMLLLACRLVCDAFSISDYTILNAG
jgi:hypothetical protein